MIGFICTKYNINVVCGCVAVLCICHNTQPITCPPNKEQTENQIELNGNYRIFINNYTLTQEL